MIESVNNERVKKWAKLKNRKYQNEYGLFLVEGEHLVEEAQKCGNLDEVIILDGYEYDYENSVVVSESVMKKITSLTSAPSIIGVVRTLNSRDMDGLVVILDGIQDPGNMGTIIRSAVAFGIDSIVLGRGCVSIYNPKVVRSTEGQMFHINIIEGDVLDTIYELHRRGYEVYSTKVDGGTVLKDAQFSSKCAIVLGSEGQGVSPQVQESCDEFIYIPMVFECESLNVGVAGSIIMYELTR